MNTKNMLLLPLIFITNINAISIGNNLKKRNTELHNCENYWLESSRDECRRKQQPLYDEAKEEFLTPLKKIINEGVETAKKPSWYQNREKREQTILLAHIAGGFSESLNGSNGPKLKNYKNTEEFCEHVLEIFATHGASTIVSDRIGSIPHLIPEKQLQKATETIREIIKKQLAQESKLAQQSIL
ncbi:MAG TPA: hypothetical protein VL201_04585 [Patescibacteria group bacterium]|nr:hypothetical protein [Patescibacteria group bacterium]